MANRRNRSNISDERIEDSTMYGEFIPSFDGWITPDRQRMVARRLSEATDGTSSTASANEVRK